MHPEGQKGRFSRKNEHWQLVNNPFPARLHPGSCLDLLIRYKAGEKCPKCLELVIESDDPKNPRSSNSTWMPPMHLAANRPVQARLRLRQ